MVWWMLWCVSRISRKGGAQGFLMLSDPGPRPGDALGAGGQQTLGRLMAPLTQAQRPSMWWTVSNDRFWNLESYVASSISHTNQCVLCLGVEEVVDLTCEGSECAVVDLTNNDSVLVKQHNCKCSYHTHTHTLSLWPLLFMFCCCCCCCFSCWRKVNGYVWLKLC